MIVVYTCGIEDFITLNLKQVTRVSTEIEIDVLDKHIDKC